jgi:hypothetical protein
MLTPDQSRFFRTQLEAASDLAFSSTAHQVGALSMTGMRYSMNMSSRTIDVLEWPDVSQQGAQCTLLSSSLAYGGGFACLSSQRGDITVEGMYAKGGYDVLLYGKKTFTYDDANDKGLRKLPFHFFTGMSDQIGDFQRYMHKPKAGVAGIDSHTAGRLLRSMQSLSAAMIIGGVEARDGMRSCIAYDLTRTLFKRAVSQPLNQPVRQEEALQGPMSFIASGSVVFASKRYGQVVIQSAESYPHGYLLTLAAPPTVDEPPCMVEHYEILRDNVYSEYSFLPSEVYDKQGILGFARAMAAPQRRVAVDKPMEPGLIRPFEKKLNNMLTEQVELS